MEHEIEIEEIFDFEDLFFSCPKCHFDFLMDGYVFCPNCGYRIIQGDVNEFFTVH